MAPSVVLVTGVSRFLGGHLAARLAADPSIERVLGVDTVPPAPRSAQPDGPDRVRPRRHPQPADRQGRSHRAEVDTVVHAALSPDPSGAWRVGDEGDERPRHHAAARGVPEGADGAARGARVDHRGLRGQPAGPGAVRRDDDAERPADRRVRPRRHGDRGLPARASPAGGRTSRSPCCASPASSARGSTRWSRATSRCRWSRPSSATTPACSCCTRKTRWPCSNARSRATTCPGVFNVAADGVLLLSQAIRRAGRVPLPVPQPAVGAVGPGARRGAGSSRSPRSSCGCSTSGGSWTPPACARTFGFTPRWTTVQAFDDFVRGRALHPAARHERVEPAVRLVDRGVHAAARVLADGVSAIAGRAVTAR